MFERTRTKEPMIRDPETFMDQDKNTYLLGTELRGEKEHEGQIRALKTNSGNSPMWCGLLWCSRMRLNNRGDLGDTLLQFLHFVCRENTVWDI